MDTSQWAPVTKVSSTTSSTITTTGLAAPQWSQQQLVERRTRPLKEQALNCPRCNSTNTKFCYYNNYSLTQPRYYCKTCRRYWTVGGSLRNVPVGGGSRKNKKHSSSNSVSSSSSSKINLQPSDPITNPKTYNGQGQDLNLGFPLNSLPHLIGGSFPNIESTTISGGLSAMELLRSTTPSRMYCGGGGFGLNEFSSSANTIKFNPLNGIGDGMQLFPFGDLKQVNVKPTNHENEQIKGQSGDQNSIFWNGANLGSGGGVW